VALCPFARQRLIPESWTQGRITPRLLIFHEAVSSADSLYNYWNSPGVDLESHFYVYRDGSLDQYVDTEVRADANTDANGFAISVETWDNGGDVNGYWTDAQLATLTRLAAWCEDVHAIPPVVPASWNGTGMGWHNLFTFAWAGGARDCPGPNRAAQVRNHIIPAVRAGYDWQTGDDDMPSHITLYDGRRITFDEWARHVYGTAGDLHDMMMFPVIDSASGGYKLSGKDLLVYIDHNGIKLDRMLTIMAAIAENGAVTPEELDRITRSAAAESGRQIGEAVAQRVNATIGNLVEQALEKVQGADNEQEVSELLRRIATLVPAPNA
jgi:hypothetical protein